MKFFINGIRVPRSVFEQESDNLVEIKVDDVRGITSGLKFVDEYTEYLQNFPFASLDSSEQFHEFFRRACFVFNYDDDEFLK